MDKDLLAWKKVARAISLSQKLDLAAQQGAHRYHFLRVVGFLLIRSYFATCCPIKKNISFKKTAPSPDMNTRIMASSFSKKQAESFSKSKVKPLVRYPVNKTAIQKGSSKKLKEVSLIRDQKGKADEQSDESWRSLMKKQEERQFQITR